MTWLEATRRGVTRIVVLAWEIKVDTTGVIEHMKMFLSAHDGKSKYCTVAAENRHRDMSRAAESDRMCGASAVR